jgi:hypothetical protein
MPQLLDLPRYLLDMGARELQLGLRHGYKDQKKFALVCRKLHLMSQKALHRNVVIERHEHENIQFEYYRLSALGRLDPTLLERPDLAHHIHSAEVDITKSRADHKSGCCCRT